MTKARVLTVVAVATAIVAVAGCGGKSSSGEGATTAAETTASGGDVLDGTVGPGFDIALKQNGTAVTTLAPGTYTLNVDDQADSHNFHLTGPGVDVSTGVGEKGTKSFTITLEKGSYHFQCDPHASSMNGDFNVS